MLRIAHSPMILGLFLTEITKDHEHKSLVEHPVLPLAMFDLLKRRKQLLQVSKCLII